MLKKLTRNFLLTLLFSSLSFATSATGDWVYTVKQGDTLWSLAEDFMVDVRYWHHLQKANNILDISVIPPGTKLKIPLKWTKRNPSDALVSKTSGTVFVTLADKGKRKKLNSQMKLRSGDKIVTAAGASTTLVFGDGSILVLRENSELMLGKLEFYGNEDVYNSELELHSGQSENKINPTKKPGSRFNIRTPSATAAVRGTVYRVTAPNERSTTTEVLEGKVELSNDMGATMVPNGYGTIAHRGEAPSVPTTLLSAPNLSGVPALFETLPLRIKFPEVERAQAYRVQIAVNADFEALTFNEIVKTSIASITELADGKYYLKVRGIDANQLEGFDEVTSFFLNAKPEAPVLVQPQHEAAVSLGTTIFEWSSGRDISAYHFQLADNAEFNKPLIDLPNHQGARVETNVALVSGQWFWRVAALDAAEGAGPFGAVSQFRVMVAGLEAEDIDTNVDNLVLRWPAIDAGEQYRFQLAKDDDFTHLILDKKITESHHKLSWPEGSGNIYLRTKVIESDGFEGSWGRSQMLKIPEEKAVWKAALPLLLLILL